MLSWRASKRLKDRLAFHTLMFRHSAEDGIQRLDAKVFVGRHSESLVRRFLSLHHEVASFLMADAIAPIAAKSLDKVVPAQVAWDLHELARTSSRTKWRRIAAGCFGWSK